MCGCAQDCRGDSVQGRRGPGTPATFSVWCDSQCPEQEHFDCAEHLVRFLFQHITLQRTANTPVVLQRADARGRMLCMFLQALMQWVLAAQGVEKPIVSKMLVEGSNRRAYAVDRHAGVVSTKPHNWLDDAFRLGCERAKRAHYMLVSPALLGGEHQPHDWLIAFRLNFQCAKRVHYMLGSPAVLGCEPDEGVVVVFALKSFGKC